MANLGEIIRALYGVWRLVCRDPAALALFDTSVAGAWRSFTAAVLFAPVNFLLTALVMGRISPPVDPGQYWLVEVMTYVIAWVAFPVVAAVVLDQFDRGDRLPALVCVYNWVALALNGVFAALNLIVLAGVLPSDFGSFAWLIAYFGTLYVLWLTMRAVTALPGLTAAGLVALDQVLSYALVMVSRQLY